MPPPAVFFFTQDDQINIDASLVDEDGNAVDLTNFETIQLFVEGIGVDSPSGSPFTGSNPSPTTGLARYTVTVGDFSAGRYRAQFRVTDSGTQILNSEVFQIHVKPTVGE